MQVMVLAAGRSTRLGVLGAQRPKPLVPVCGYPAISFALTLCARAGLRDVVVNLHHHGDQIRRALGDGAALGVKVRYSAEDELLGTGGGLAYARRLFQPGPVLVVNGKVVADVDLRAVIAAHRAAPPGTVATMVLREAPRPGEFAPVSVDAAGRVIGLREKPGPMTKVVGPLTELMFTGIHVLEPALLDRLPAGPSDVITHAYRPALDEGAPVQGFVMRGYFEEHSTPERYLSGNLALLRRPDLLAYPPGELVGVDQMAKVDPSAIIRPPVRIAAEAVIEAGAVVGPEVVVCRGARVAADARLTRAVVWEGAEAGGQLQDAVVTGAGVVEGLSSECLD
jgi:mannose-1-phosphate guanylyltransferase